MLAGCPPPSATHCFEQRQQPQRSPFLTSNPLVCGESPVRRVPSCKQVRYMAPCQPGVLIEHTTPRVFQLPLLLLHFPPPSAYRKLAMQWHPVSLPSLPSSSLDSTWQGAERDLIAAQAPLPVHACMHTPQLPHLGEREKEALTDCSCSSSRWRFGRRRLTHPRQSAQCAHCRHLMQVNQQTRPCPYNPCS